MITHSFPEIIQDRRVDLYLPILHSIKTHQKVILEFRRSTQISPAGYAILACISDVALEQNCSISWQATKEIEIGQPFITQLKKIHEKNKSLPQPSIYNFETSTCLVTGNKQAVNLGFTENLESKFVLEDDLLFDCNLILHELMQNTITHSGAERYFMYAGLWKNEIHLGVLDMGISIPAKLKQKYIRDNHIDYILLAMQEGSTTRRVRSGGFGLYHFHDFLKRNKAKLTIVSGEAQVRRYFRTRKVQETPLKYYLPGTWCFARMPYRKRSNH